MIKVLFVTSGTETLASSRYRVYELLPHLERYPIETEVRTAAAIDTPFPRSLERASFGSKLLLDAPRFDIVYLQKVLPPPQFLQVLEKLTHCVFDFDDALYASQPWSNTQQTEKIKALNDILRVVSTVVTGGPELTGYAKRYAADVYCLPTAIPRDQYTPYQDFNGSKNHSDQIIIGWIGNPENLWYLSNIESAISDVLNQNRGLKLDIVTAGNLEYKPLEERDDVYYREWSIERELDLLADVDIAIRPLTDDEWTRSKGGFTSVIQCMAMGIPVVVSSVGTLPVIISHGENGYLVSDDSEWITYLNHLIECPNERKRLGKNAIDTVSDERFWSEQRAEDLYNLLKKIIL